MSPYSETLARLSFPPGKLRNDYAYFRAGNDEVVVEYHPLPVRGEPPHRILSGRFAGTTEELDPGTALEDALDEQLQLENGQVYPDNMWPVYRRLGYESVEEAANALRDDPQPSTRGARKRGRKRWLISQHW